MKKKIAIINMAFIVILSLAACKNETAKKIKNAQEAVGNTRDLIKNATKLEKNAEKMEKRVEELKKMTPFDNEKFKSWMPETLDNMPRTSFNFQSMQASTGKLEFKSEMDDRDFRISIIDGAGEQGAAIYTFQGFYTGMAEGFESESDNKIEKVEQRDGQNSLETYYKKDKNAEIKTCINDRFIVEAKGNNMTTEELWKLIEKLNIGKLK